ncbi:MAG: hypothetical protein SF029_25320 [bacterium]|nr:hypothetical protein [bacterium]
MASAPNVRPLESVKRHRRETLRALTLPAIFIAVLIIVFVLSLVIPGSPFRLREQVQVNIIANWMLMCFVLCPVVLCLFPIYVILMASTFGLNWLHNVSARNLRRAQTASRTIADRTANVSEDFSRRSANFNVRFAFIDALINIFDRYSREESENAHDSKHE